MDAKTRAAIRRAEQEAEADGMLEPPPDEDDESPPAEHQPQMSQRQAQGVPRPLGLLQVRQQLSQLNGLLLAVQQSSAQLLVGTEDHAQRRFFGAILEQATSAESVVSTLMAQRSHEAESMFEADRVSLASD